MNYSRHYDFIMSTFDDWSQCRFNTNFLKITKESLENKTLYNNPKYVFDAIFVMSSLKFFGNTNRFYNSPSADDITAMLMDILTNVDPEYLFASKSELLHQNPFSAIIDLGRNKRKWKWNELDDTERMYIADQQNVWHVLLQHQKGDMSDDVYVSILRNIRFALEYPFDASEFKELYDKDNGKDVMYHIIPNQFSEERALAKEWALLMEGSTCPVDPSPFGGSEKMKLREKKFAEIIMENGLTDKLIVESALDRKEMAVMGFTIPESATIIKHCNLKCFKTSQPMRLQYDPMAYQMQQQPMFQPQPPPQQQPMFQPQPPPQQQPMFQPQPPPQQQPMFQPQPPPQLPPLFQPQPPPQQQPMFQPRHGPIRPMTPRHQLDGMVNRECSRSYSQIVFYDDDVVFSDSSHVSADKCGAEDVEQ